MATWYSLPFTVDEMNGFLTRIWQRDSTEIYENTSRRCRLGRSGVEGSLFALVRGQGMWVSRYIRQEKRNLHAIFTGCTANLKRTANGCPANNHRCGTKKLAPEPCLDIGSATSFWLRGAYPGLPTLS